MFRRFLINLKKKIVLAQKPRRAREFFTKLRIHSFNNFLSSVVQLTGFYDFYWLKNFYICSFKKSQLRNVK